MRLLVEARGRLLTKEELLERLWPDVVVGEESLTQAIRKLRGVLGDDPRQPRFVETVMKRGYRWIAVVTLEEAQAAAPVAPPPPTPEWTTEPLTGSALPTLMPGPSAPAEARRSSRRSLGLVAALLLLGTLAAAGPRLLRSFHAPEPEPFALERIRPRRLTTTGPRELHGWLAPDGRSFVYSANVDGQFDLFLASLAGGEPVRLTRTPEDEHSPQLAPDSSRLLFGREHPTLGGGTLWLAGAFGGDERMLSSRGAEGAFSPDGRSVAYARHEEDGSWSLVRLEIATGTERALHHSSERLGSVAWQPVAEWIAFSEGGRVEAVPEGGGKVRTILDRSKFVERLVWDPTGRSLIADAQFSGENRRLWRLPLDGTPPRPITEQTGDTCCPSLSTDGRHLLYTLEHKQRQLWRAAASGEAPTLIALPSTVEGLDVSRDGEALAFTDWEALPGSSSLGLLRFDSGTVQTLGEGLAPAFSPDGRFLAFLGTSTAEEGLWMLELASGARRRLATATGPPGFRPQNLDRRPAWSPDGGRIAYTDLGGAPALVVVEVASGTARRLVEARLGPAAWSPDGTELAACGATEAGSGLQRIVVATGATTHLSPHCSYRAAPVWQSDGSIVLLIDERRDPALLRLDSEGRAAGVARPLRRPSDPAFWGIFDARPDGAGGWIYLLERYEGDLYLLDATP